MNMGPDKLEREAVPDGRTSWVGAADRYEFTVTETGGVRTKLIPFSDCD